MNAVYEDDRESDCGCDYDQCAGNEGDCACEGDCDDMDCDCGFEKERTSHRATAATTLVERLAGSGWSVELQEEAVGYGSCLSFTKKQ